MAYATSQIEQLRMQRDTLNAEIQALESSSRPSATFPCQSSSSRHHQHKKSNVPRTVAALGLAENTMDEYHDTNGIARSLSYSGHLLYPTMSQGEVPGKFEGSPFGQTQNHDFMPLSEYLVSESSVIKTNWEKSEPILDSHRSCERTQQLHSQHSQRSTPFFRSSEQHDQLSDLPGVGEYLARSGLPMLQVPPPSLAPRPTPYVGFSPSISGFNLELPPTPSTSQMSYSTTYSSTHDTASMGRSPSLFDGKFDMIRLNSTTSYNEVDSPSQRNDYVGPVSDQSFRFSEKEQAQLLAGAGGIDCEPSVVQSISSGYATAMEKSNSNESNVSTASRNRQRLQLQIQQAGSRVIEPKCDGSYAMSRDNSTQHSTLGASSSDAAESTHFKTGHARKKQERVCCLQCSNHPRFRGEHELRRHEDRAHKTLVKKYIVIEPEGQDREKPVLPLTDCKACSQTVKQYGAYYNVAAHLRRAHFKPKMSKKMKGNKDKEERRGGKGGGDWPPMSELRHWMKEVEVDVSIKQESTGHTHSSMTEYSQDVATTDNFEKHEFNNDEMDLLDFENDGNYSYNTATQLQTQNTTFNDTSRHHVNDAAHFSFSQRDQTDMLAPFDLSTSLGQVSDISSAQVYYPPFNM